MLNYTCPAVQFSGYMSVSDAIKPLRNVVATLQWVLRCTYGTQCTAGLSFERIIMTYTHDECYMLFPSCLLIEEPVPLHGDLRYISLVSVIQTVRHCDTATASPSHIN